MIDFTQPPEVLDLRDRTLAFVREVVGKFLSGLVLCLGYLWMLWDAERQCWHDKLVGTRVVRVVRAVPAGPAVRVY